MSRSTWLTCWKRASASGSTRRASTMRASGQTGRPSTRWCATSASLLVVCGWREFERHRGAEGELDQRAESLELLRGQATLLKQVERLGSSLRVALRFGSEPSRRASMRAVPLVELDDGFALRVVSITAKWSSSQWEIDCLPQVEDSVSRVEKEGKAACWVSITRTLERFACC